MTINNLPPSAAGIAGGVARSDHFHASAGRMTLRGPEEGSMRPGVVDDIGSMEDYVPDSIASLVAGTPADDLQRAMEDLKRTAVVTNGHRLPPLPEELFWASGAEINSVTLHAMMHQVVQMELEKFARRLERYYHIIPKTNNEQTNVDGAVGTVPDTSEVPVGY